MNKLFDSRINSRYLKYLLKQDFKMMMVMTLFFFLIMPFSLYIGLNSNFYSEVQLYSIHTNVTFGLIFFIILCVIIPCLLLSFIMNRNKMDTYQSLPIRKQDLFLNHFIEALVVILVPFLISYLLSGLYFNSFNVVNFELMEYLRDGLIIALITPLLVGISQFAFISAGRLFDGMLFSGFLHISQLFSLSVVSMLFNEKLFGLGNTLDRFYTSFLSPIWALLKIVDNPQINWPILMWIILGFILYFINQQLYVSRKTENIDDSTVFGWFIPFVVTTAFTIFISFMLLGFLTTNSSLLSTLVLPLLVALVIYLVVDAIIHRGFQNLYQAMLRFVLIATACVALIYSSIYSGFFGTTRKVLSPNEYDVAFISMNSPFGYGYDSNIDYSSYVNGAKTIYDIINTTQPTYPGENYYTYVIDQADEKEQLSKSHKAFIDDYYRKMSDSGISIGNYNSYHYPYDSAVNYSSKYGSLFITYVKDGRVILRRLYPSLTDTIYNDYFEDIGKTK